MCICGDEVEFGNSNLTLRSCASSREGPLAKTLYSFDSSFVFREGGPARGNFEDMTLASIMLVH